MPNGVFTSLPSQTLIELSVLVRSTLSARRGPIPTNCPCAREAQAKSSHQAWSRAAQNLGKCISGKHQLLCTCPHTLLRACSEPACDGWRPQKSRLLRCSCPAHAHRRSGHSSAIEMLAGSKPSVHRGPIPTNCPCAREAQAKSSHQAWSRVAQNLGKCISGKHQPLCTCQHKLLRACSEP